MKRVLSLILTLSMLIFPVQGHAAELEIVGKWNLNVYNTAVTSLNAEMPLFTGEGYGEGYYFEFLNDGKFTYGDNSGQVGTGTWTDFDRGVPDRGLVVEMDGRRIAMIPSCKLNATNI